MRKRVYVVATQDDFGMTVWWSEDQDQARADAEFVSRERRQPDYDPCEHGETATFAFPVPDGLDLSTRGGKDALSLDVFRYVARHPELFTGRRRAAGQAGK